MTTKKATLIALILMALQSSLGAEEKWTENPLAFWAVLNWDASSTGHPPISVTAYLKHSGDDYLLAFKLTNSSNAPLVLYPFQLPWGGTPSMLIAAVDTDGQRVMNGYGCDLPSPQNKITIAVGESIEGDYNIEKTVQLSQAPKDKDIIVIWSYALPSESEDPQPICTGAVVIERQK